MRLLSSGGSRWLAYEAVVKARTASSTQRTRLTVARDTEKLARGFVSQPELRVLRRVPALRTARPGPRVSEPGKGIAMSIGSSADLAGIRLAGRITRETLDALESRVRVGMSTAELDAIAAAVLAAHGARSTSSTSSSRRTGTSPTPRGR